MLPELLSSCALYVLSYSQHGVVLIALLLGILMLVAYLQPQRFVALISHQTNHQVFYYALTKKSVCALTIDDAPSASTLQILDVLKEHNVKATFFVIASQIPGHEDAMKRIVEDGHQLGNHLTEDYPSIRYEASVFKKKLLECEERLTSFQKHRPERVKWVRPGSGWFNTTMMNTAHSHNYRICLGNVYPHDAQISSEFLNEAYLRNRTRSGSIIIVHDRSWTIGVLRKALPELSKKFQFVDLHELEELDEKWNHKRE